MSNFKTVGVITLAILTFLVSFYNAEKYIASCIENLKKQTNPYFLCILVDDGSIDKSYEIASSKVKDDKRFTVIRHIKNQGLGAGRETGIKNTKTEFLTFFDADDEIAFDAVDKIILNINAKPNADLFVFDFYKRTPNAEELITGNADTTAEFFLSEDKRISHVWHKVYRTSMLKNMDLSFYRTISFAEDLYLSVKSFLNSKETVFINDAYYYYNFNEQSMVNSRTKKSILENIEVVENLLNDSQVKSSKEIMSYIKNESYHTFGLLIFPNKKNIFQWKTPHFSEWKKINSYNKIFIPDNTSRFVKIYLASIKTGLFPLSYILWNILKLKELLKQTDCGSK